jgi:gluconate 2-dehydrogenase gamma chain
MSLQEHDSPEMLQRREILRRVAWLMGGAVSAPAALAILQGCSAQENAPKAAAGWTPKFFKGEQRDVITAIADIIIPRTDTSGALDAGVPAFIDLMLADVYDDAARERFNAGYAAFDASLRGAGSPFLEQSNEQRTFAVKQELERALQETGPKPFMLMTRELTLLGFYTSKVGISENMEYVSVPTVFRGCVPLSSLAKPVYWE